MNDSGVIKDGLMRRLRRGFFRLWILLSMVWIVVVAIVGFSGATNDWRLWAADMSPEAVVDRSLAWIPSFRPAPLRKKEMEDALSAMNDGLSLIVFVQPHPSSNPINFEDLVPFSWPSSPSYEQIEAIPVGSPPKIMQVRFFDGSTYEIEFPPRYSGDLNLVRANIRNVLLELCGSTAKCRGSKPGLTSMLAEQGGFLLAPPLLMLILGASLLWVISGFSEKS